MIQNEEEDILLEGLEQLEYEREEETADRLKKAIWTNSEFISLLCLYLDHDINSIRTFWKSFHLKSFHALLRDDPNGVPFSGGFWLRLLWMQLFIREKVLPSDGACFRIMNLQKANYRPDLMEYLNVDFQSFEGLLGQLLEIDWRREWKARTLSQCRWALGQPRYIANFTLLGDKLIPALREVLVSGVDDNQDKLEDEPADDIILGLSLHPLRSENDLGPSRWLAHLWDAQTGASRGCLMSSEICQPRSNDATSALEALQIKLGFASAHHLRPLLPESLSHHTSIRLLGGAHHPSNRLLAWSTAASDRILLHIGRLDFEGSKNDSIDPSCPIEQHLIFSDLQMRKTRTHLDISIPLEPFQKIIFSDDGMMCVAQSGGPSRRLAYVCLSSIFTFDEMTSETLVMDDDVPSSSSVHPSPIFQSSDQRQFNPLQPVDEEYPMDWLWCGAHQRPIVDYSLLGCCSSTSSRDDDAIGFACKLVTIDEGGSIALWRLNRSKVFWLEKVLKVEATLTAVAWLAAFPHAAHSKPPLTTIFDPGNPSGHSESSYRDEPSSRSGSETDEESRHHIEGREVDGMRPFVNEGDDSNLSDREDTYASSLLSMDEVYLNNTLVDSSVFSSSFSCEESNKDALPPSRRMSLGTSLNALLDNLQTHIPSEGNNTRQSIQFLNQTFSDDSKKEVMEDLGCPSGYDSSRITIPWTGTTLDLAHLQCPEHYEACHQNPYIFVTGSESGVLALHDAREFKQAEHRPILKLRYHQHPVQHVTVGGPNQDILLSIDTEGYLAIWDLKNCLEPKAIYRVPPMIRRHKICPGDNLRVDVPSGSTRSGSLRPSIIPYGYSGRYNDLDQFPLDPSSPKTPSSPLSSPIQALSGSPDSKMSLFDSPQRRDTTSPTSFSMTPSPSYPDPNYTIPRSSNPTSHRPLSSLHQWLSTITNYQQRSSLPSGGIDRRTKRARWSLQASSNFFMITKYYERMDSESTGLCLDALNLVFAIL